MQSSKRLPYGSWPSPISSYSLVEGVSNVTDIFVVFFYGAFPNVLKDLTASGVNLHYLCTWADVLKVAQEGEYFNAKVIADVHEFLEDPVSWSFKNGGKGEN